MSASLAFLAAVHVPAQAQEPVGGKVVPDTPWSKSDGEFAAALGLEQLGGARPGRAFGDTVTIRRGTPVFASVVFSGCARAETGTCDVAARFTAKTPEGKPLGEPRDIAVGPTPPGQTQVVMMTGKLGVVLQPIDLLGVYTVRVEVRDRVSKKQIVLERYFTAVER
jgi:hypothetical protein